jgi:hypothetical protein
MTMACAPVPPASDEGPLPIHGESGLVCNAKKATGLVGKPASEALGREALRLSGAGTIRWIRPGTLVTMDYRSDRLNIHLDTNDRVSDVTCG